MKNGSRCAPALMLLLLVLFPGTLAADTLLPTRPVNALADGAARHLEVSESLLVVAAVPVPEPDSLFLVGSGLLLVLILLRKTFRPE